MFFEFLLYAAFLLLLLCAAGLVSDGHVTRALRWVARTALFRRAERAVCYRLGHLCQSKANAMYAEIGLTEQGMRVVNLLDALAAVLRDRVLDKDLADIRARHAVNA